MFRKILFCTDFSPDSDSAFSGALDIISHYPESQLIIFHVVPEPDAQFWKTYLYELEKIDEKAMKDIDERLKECYTSRIPESVLWSIKIAVGSTRQKIMETVTEEQIDLVIMGRQGSDSVSTLLLGDTAKYAVHKLPCPILVIPNNFTRKTKSKTSTKDKK